MSSDHAETFSSKTIQDYLDQHKIDAKLIHLDQDVPSVRDAARALGVLPSQILKSLVFIAAGNPCLVITAGEARINTKLLAVALGLSKSKLKFAKPEQALAVTGFVVGAMPPFGHKQSLMTVLDLTSLRETLVYAGGGTKNALLEISLETLKEVTGAKLAPLTEREEE